MFCFLPLEPIGFVENAAKNFYNSRSLEAEKVIPLDVVAQFGLAGFSIYALYSLYKDMSENQKEAFQMLAKAINGFKEELKVQSDEFRKLKDEILKLVGKINGR